MEESGNRELDLIRAPGIVAQGRRGPAWWLTWESQGLSARSTALSFPFADATAPATGLVPVLLGLVHALRTRRA